MSLVLGSRAAVEEMNTIALPVSEVGECVLDGEEVCSHVDREDEVPHVWGGAGYALAAGDADVEHEGVETAEVFRGALHGGVEGVLVAGFRVDRHGGGSFGSDGVCGVLGGGEVAVEDGYGGALAGGEDADGAPDADGGSSCP